MQYLMWNKLGVLEGAAKKELCVCVYACECACVTHLSCLTPTSVSSRVTIQYVVHYS